jgi:hypothetical protein
LTSARERAVPTVIRLHEPLAGPCAGARDSIWSHGARRRTVITDRCDHTIERMTRIPR